MLRSLEREKGWLRACPAEEVDSGWGGFGQKKEVQQLEAAQARCGVYVTGQARSRFWPEIGPEGDDVIADARLASALPNL
ncbi:hypothetical protein L3X38_035303 [Prunus dulcis]|uniref:Uncharacterized protein n=1 Tax=Prunus dulcis TaxID=3755 RepID=A0AAD4YYP2_PRUDU|nr:hypothetical protein L3X38_035303 [Prunus dulcis]